MPGSFSAITRSHHHRNFRIFFIGQLVSLIGNWITSIASSWLIYRLTGSSLLLGSLTAAGLFPTILVSPLAGVKIDRWDRRTVLLYTQAGSMLQSLILGALTLSGAISVPTLFALTIIQGFINGFDMPARQAFISEIVDSRDDLSNAIALNSSMFNGARLIGPAIGGFIISYSNEGFCFLLDGLSYLAVLASLMQIKTSSPPPKTSKQLVFKELAAGLRYAREFTPIGSLLVMVAATSFGLAPYFSLLPAFARECLNGGPDLLGVMMAVAGLGAVSGSLYLASRKSIVGLGNLIVRSGIILFVSLSALALSWDGPTAGLCLFVVGGSMILVYSSSNTILQTLVNPDMRGRIMSLYTSAFTGMLPIGSVVAGYCEGIIGLRGVMFAGGAVILLASCILQTKLPRLRQQARPIMVERGLAK